jgi:hypothetical protein
LNRSATTTRSQSGEVSPVCAVAGRILLIITAVLLVVMPLTEHFCTFDRFLTGGTEDVELTLLAVLALCCLVLLFAQFRKQDFAALNEPRRWLFPALLNRTLTSFAIVLQASDDPVVSGPSIGSFKTPLLV